MKKLFLLLLTSIAALISCSEDEPTSENKVTADFEVVVTGTAPNATITITNNSENSTEYHWQFSEGFSIDEDDVKTPTDVVADKTGTLEITLTASDGKTSKEVTKEVVVTGNDALLTFSNISFSLSSDGNIGQFFSVESEHVYRASDLTTAINPTISFAFNSIGGTMFFFQSPSERTEITSGAATAKITNYESTPTFSLAEFAALTHNGDLKDLTINHAQDSFGNSQIPGTILFELADGRKGVIKTQEKTGDALIVDIKVEKY